MTMHWDLWTPTCYPSEMWKSGFNIRAVAGTQGSDMDGQKIIGSSFVQGHERRC